MQRHRAMTSEHCGCIRKMRQIGQRLRMVMSVDHVRSAMYLSKITVNCDALAADFFRHRP